MKFTRDNRASISLVVVLFLQICPSTNAFISTKVRQSAQNYLRQAVEDGNEEPLPSSSVSSEGIAYSPGEATLRLGLSSAPTVWTEFGRIAQEHDPVNLGQGFPDWLPPKFAVDSLVEAVLDSAQSPHQYTRPAGHPNLVRQLARRYSIHMKQEIKPMEEVAVTVGASQALYLSLQTLIKPGKCSISTFVFFDPATPP
jgi:DNA-binding transcriptional MocR family regulator